MFIEEPETERLPSSIDNPVDGIKQHESLTSTVTKRIDLKPDRSFENWEEVRAALTREPIDKFLAIFQRRIAEYKDRLVRQVNYHGRKPDEDLAAIDKQAAYLTKRIECAYTDMQDWKEAYRRSQHYKKISDGINIEYDCRGERDEEFHISLGFFPVAIPEGPYMHDHKRDIDKIVDQSIKEAFPQITRLMVDKSKELAQADEKERQRPGFKAPDIWWP